MIDRSEDRGYVGLTWEDVRAVLGRDHRGTPEDDAALTEHLIAQGAPAAAREFDGFTDEVGWYVRTR